MELKKQYVNRNYEKARAVSQMTVGDDISIPETKPRILEILQKKAELLIQEVHTEKSKVHLKGVLRLCVLYTAGDSLQPVDSLEPELPFDEVLYVEGASPGDNLKIDWKIEELLVSVIHSGKIGVRAVITLEGEIIGAETLELTGGAEEETGVYTRACSVEMAEPVVNRKDTFHVRDEVTLPANKPNIRKLLWKSMQLRGLDLRILEGQIGVKGELLLFVIYQGDNEEESIQWLEQSVPFHGAVDVNGITPEMYGMLESEVAHQEVEIKPDYDGEMRQLQVELLLDLQMRIFEEKTRVLLCDAYSTERELKLTKAAVPSQRLLSCNRSKCRISGRLGAGGEDTVILQLLGHQADLRRQEVTVTADGVEVRGDLEVQVLYIAADDQRPFGVLSDKIPYSQQIELPGITDQDLLKIHETIEQISIAMPDSSQVEVKATVQINICAMKQEEVSNVTAIEVLESSGEEGGRRPGMSIHWVQPGESLWDIAKRNKTTMDMIKKMNELSTEEVKTGQKLILIKQTAEKI